MTTTLELLAQIKNKEISTRSELNLRNEERQVKAKSNYLKYLKKEKDLIAKLLFPTELVFPFNPLTIEEDDDYNKVTKFRTEKSFSSIALALKSHYNENEDIKKKYMDYVGLEHWDTSDTENITQRDINAFRKFRKVRIFTNDMVKINLFTLTKKNFACDYLANFTRDDLGDPVTEDGEYPEILEIQRLYRSVAQEEYNEWEKQNSSKSEQDKKKQWLAVMGTCPISPDMPVNVALVSAIPIDSNFNPKEKISKEEDIRNTMVLFRLSKDTKSLVESVITKFTTSDVNADFIEIDMTVGNEDDDNERGKNTKYEKASTALKNRVDDDGNHLTSDYDAICSSLKEYIDNFENLDKTVKKATVFNKINEDSIQSIYAALEVDKPYDSIERFLTDQIGKTNGNTLSRIYGGKADDFLCALTLGDAKKGTATEEQIKNSETDLRDILAEKEEVGGFSGDIED